MADLQTPMQAPAYRLGAVCRQRDRSGQPEGYDHLRHAVLAAIRTPGKLK